MPIRKIKNIPIPIKFCVGVEVDYTDTRNPVALDDRIQLYLLYFLYCMDFTFA